MSEIEDRIKALESELAEVKETRMQAIRAAESLKAELAARRDRNAEIVKRLRAALERANTSVAADVDQIYDTFWSEVREILNDMEKSIHKLGHKRHSERPGHRRS